MASQPEQPLPVIIVGAGIVGLTLAQALKKHNIAYLIFERDAHHHARSSGWGLSICPEALRHCLPAALFELLHSAKVDPRQEGTGTLNRTCIFRHIYMDLSLLTSHRLLESGTGFLNLESGKPEFEIPSNRRLRVNRGLLRELLAAGIDVNWGKEITGFKATDAGVSVFFLLMQHVSTQKYSKPSLAACVAHNWSLAYPRSLPFDSRRKKFACKPPGLMSPKVTSLS